MSKKDKANEKEKKTEGKNEIAFRSNGKRYTLGEEIFNAITHGLGSLLSCAGCVLLIIGGVIWGDVWSVVGGAIFGASLIILYTMSTLYHSITNAKAKEVFRKFDHDTIFFLIAGTYTPITLCAIKRVNIGLGWTLFGIVWAAAIVGIVLNSISVEKFKKFSAVCYIVMGWIVVIAIKPLIDYLGVIPLIFLFGGGVFYTGGMAFYAMKRKKWMHTVWHFCTIFGSVAHFFFVFLFVLPTEPLFDFVGKMPV